KRRTNSDACSWPWRPSSPRPRQCVAPHRHASLEETFSKSKPGRMRAGSPSAGTRPGDAISKSDHARARAQKEQSGSFSYLCSLHIGLGSSVDPDHVAGLDEKRNLDRRPALELGRLGASRNRVAFEAR